MASRESLRGDALGGVGDGVREEMAGVARGKELDVTWARQLGVASGPGYRTLLEPRLHLPETKNTGMVILCPLEDMCRLWACVVS